MLRTVLFALIFFLSLCCSAPAQISGDSTAPHYTAAGIVNAATETATPLAPNTIGALYGTNLAYSTGTVAASDVAGGSLPIVLDGVAVWVNGIPCGLFYISPVQINFLVPYELIAGPATLIVARQGVAGPSVQIQLASASPGLFLIDARDVHATHLTGQQITPDFPAAAGEIVILYAEGLGRTAPDTSSNRLATAAAKLYYAAQFQLLLDGTPVAADAVLYAGLAPGFAGLYQINLRLPAGQSPNPEIRLEMGDQISPAGVYLPVQ